MSTRNAVRRLISPGGYVLFLFFLAGIWLTISPFAMTTQPSGSHWIASTINNVTIGAIMMVVSLLGILGYMLFALRDMIREAEAKQADEQQASQLGRVTYYSPGTGK
jgi:hypothetical protein